MTTKSGDATLCDGVDYETSRSRCIESCDRFWIVILNQKTKYILKLFHAAPTIHPRSNCLLLPRNGFSARVVNVSVPDFLSIVELHNNRNNEVAFPSLNICLRYPLKELSPSMGMHVFASSRISDWSKNLSAWLSY